MNDKFISFEGIDGSGKTTQIKLLSKYLDVNNFKNIIIREPGYTNISESIRKILLDDKNIISSSTETLLFLSARSQLVHEVIIPKLKNKEIILCDRYIDSTLAYQGYGHKQNIDLINKMNLFATSNTFPHLTVIFDLDPRISLKRLGSKSLDRMESMSLKFFERVREGYFEISKIYPNRCKIIECNDKNIMSIHAEVLNLFNILSANKE